MSSKVLPIKILNNCFPATVSDAVKITNSKENIKQYTDRQINELKNYCDNNLRSDIINYLNISRTINVVKDLGVVPNNSSEEIRVSNAEKIKQEILKNRSNFNGKIILYFPAGEYHINPIRIDGINDTLSNGDSVQNLDLIVSLIGESNNIDNNSCNISVEKWCESEYVEPSIDWSKIEVDTPICVSDNTEGIWKNRYFAKYEGDKIYAWSGGRTSWSANNETDYTRWRYAKLADKLHYND